MYANTFNHGFVLDDDVVFLKNRYVQSGIAGIPDIIGHGFLHGFNQKNDQSYRPVVLINYAIEKSLFGNNPKAHHRLNVLYYAILCCLVFLFLQLLFKAEGPWLSFWISLLFVLHPIHTEVVANIKGRDDILHSIFLLLSFINALRYVDGRKTNFLVLALCCYFLALLSKEIAVTFVLLLPLTLWVFRGMELGKMLKVTSYFAGAVVLYFILRNAILDTITFEEKMKVINNSLAAAPTYPDQLATTFVIFWNYVKLLFYPHPLAWDYSYPHFPIVSFSNPLVILIVSGFLSALIFGLLKLKVKNKLAYCLFFFLISFSIVSNFFVLIGSTLGERFLFLPSIAFCMFLVLGMDQLINASKAKNKSKILPTLMVVIAVLYSFKTIDRNKDWVSNEQLFISGAAATPNNSRAISALGTVYRERGERSTNQQEQLRNYQAAIQYYSKSIELYPQNMDSHYNLGVVYMNSNQLENAKVAFSNAIQIEPNYMNALNNLGVIYFNEQNYSAAEQYFLKCLQLNASFQNAHANLGAVYHNLGDRQKAEQYYRSALQLNANDQNTRANLNKLVGVTD